MLITILNLLNYATYNYLPFYGITAIIIALYAYIIKYYYNNLIENKYILVLLLILLIIDITCIIFVYTNFYNDDITLKGKDNNIKIIKNDKKDNKKKLKPKPKNKTDVQLINDKTSLDELLTYKSDNNDTIETYRTT
jgi:hypothetical protein